MIFGRKTGDRGEEFVLIGLSVENIGQMIEGKSITIGPVAGDPALSNLMIVIVSGQTEQDMIAPLQKLGLVDPSLS